MTNDPQDTSVNSGEGSAPVAQPYRVQRDGGRDLSFEGMLIGEGYVESGRTSQGFTRNPRERSVQVRIYATTKGRLIAHVHRETNWGDDSRDEAMVCNDGGELLAFLENSNTGSLGQASRDAWNEACEKYPPLAPLAVEVIE